MMSDEQLEACRRLYFANVPLDETADGYRRVIRSLLDTVRDLQRQLVEARSVLAEAYQLAGAYGADIKALDNLSAAANGKPLPHATFLPAQLERLPCGHVRADLEEIGGFSEGYTRCRSCEREAERTRALRQQAGELTIASENLVILSRGLSVSLANARDAVLQALTRYRAGQQKEA